MVSNRFVRALVVAFAAVALTTACGKKSGNPIGPTPDPDPVPTTFTLPAGSVVHQLGEGEDLISGFHIRGRLNGQLISRPCTEAGEVIDLGGGRLACNIPLEFSNGMLYIWTCHGRSGGAPVCDGKRITVLGQPTKFPTPLPGASNWLVASAEVERVGDSIVVSPE